MDSKVCSKCGGEKPLEAFEIRRDSGRRRNQCHDCRCKGKRLPLEEQQRRYRDKMLRRFWGYANRTSDDACWLWSGEIGFKGYGVMHFYTDGRPVRQKAHRFSWELHNGSVPEGIFVLHHCDTPACVNPGHLFLGDQGDNMRDMAHKKRDYLRHMPSELHARGIRNGQSKLTEGEVRAIRAAFAAGVSRRDLASQYGVTWENINHIVRRESWRHVA